MNHQALTSWGCGSSSVLGGCAIERDGFNKSNVLASSLNIQRSAQIEYLFGRCVVAFTLWLKF